MAAAAATRFGSASGITISGALEPSSMVTRFSPATWQMRSPMSRLPVNVILRTRGSLHRALPRLPPGPVRHCTASGGTPASTNSSISLRADSGVSVAGLMMQALPAAIAGPTLWHTRCSGKLNGLMPTTTPHGTRRVKPSLPLTPGAPSSGITSPDEALRLFRRQHDDLPRPRRLDLRLAQNLALFQGNGPRQVVGALAHQVGDLHQDLVALVAGHVGHDTGAALGGGERLLDVGQARLAARCPRPTRRTGSAPRSCRPGPPSCHPAAFSCSYSSMRRPSSAACPIIVLRRRPCQSPVHGFLGHLGRCRC